MGNCNYCGQKAGLFKSYHKECESSYLTTKQSVPNLIMEAITKSYDFSKVISDVEKIASANHIPKHEMNGLYNSGFDKAIELFLEDGLISVDEEEKIANFKNDKNFAGVLLDSGESLQKVLKALILRDIVEGKEIVTRLTVNGTLPILLQKGEKIIWLFHNVGFYEPRVKTVYHGSSHGMSIPIGHGIYYRVGSFKGNPVKSEEMTFIGNGMVVLTNTTFYYISQTKTIKIPYKKLISITPYSDGVGVQKDGVSSKQQLFTPLDGWFTYNLLLNLHKL